MASHGDPIHARNDYLNGFAHAADPRNNKKKIVFNIKHLILRSETYFKMILRLVAPFSQSMSSFGTTATHFVTKTMIFGSPANTKIHYPDI